MVVESLQIEVLLIEPEELAPNANLKVWEDRLSKMDQ